MRRVRTAVPAALTSLLRPRRHCEDFTSAWALVTDCQVRSYRFWVQARKDAS